MGLNLNYKANYFNYFFGLSSYFKSMTARTTSERNNSKDSGDKLRGSGKSGMVDLLYEAGSTSPQVYHDHTVNVR